MARAGRVCPIGAVNDEPMSHHLDASKTVNQVSKDSWIHICFSTVKVHVLNVYAPNTVETQSK